MLKSEFDKKLHELNIDRKTFATLTNISYNTVTNWNDDTKQIPNWVNSWINNYKKSIILDNMIKDLTPYLEKLVTKPSTE